MEECCGLMGMIFGYKYRSKIKTDSAPSPEQIREAYYDNGNFYITFAYGILNCIRSQTYEVVCSRCGKGIEGENKRTN